MSQENVKVVLEAVKAFEERRDFTETWHEDGRMTGPKGWPEIGPFEGRDAVFRQFARLAEDWDEHEFPDQRVVADEGEWVILETVWKARGASSGIETRFNLTGAYRVRNGRIAEAHFRWSPEEALVAAGLDR